MNPNTEKIGQEFKWGVSTAAYQIEGAWNEEGKGKSIWDVFANTKGKIYLNQNGNVACDYFHQYTHDISIMARLKIPNYRFSIAWSRILPDGIGPINPDGIDFYNRVIDFCLELGIEPWITLYHWDLPYELEKKGGWTNREVIGWFSNYVEVCMKYFGDRVKRWMILNEPLVFTGVGYFLGRHAPGRKGLKNFLSASHHAAMCQAEGGRIVRSLVKDCKVGTTFSSSYIQPFGHSPQDTSAANRIDTLFNRMFVEPLAGMGYPVKDLKMLQGMEPYIKDGDESKLAFDMDFIGVQNYTREMVNVSRITPLIWAKIISADKRNVETTVMNWEVYPEAIYEMLVKFSQYKCFKEIIVTENGAAFPDELTEGAINDTKRLNYLDENIRQVLRAKSEGVKVNGYFVWSFTDNFEWAEGYKPRFGLVYIDFSNQKRIIKKSGYWYSSLIQSKSQM